MEKTKIGVIGCGRILPAHLNAYKDLKDKNLGNALIVALCARKRSDAEQFRKRGEGPPPRERVGPKGDPLIQPHLYVSDFQPEFDAEIFTDHKEMLKKVDVDAVLIPTSVYAHHPIAVDAIEAGKHVLVEKPLAVTAKAGRKMVEAAEKRGVILGVAESAHYSSSTRMTKWIIDKGYIGDVQMTAMVSLGGFWSPDKIVAETSWRHRKLTAGGGTAIDVGVHIFNRMRYIFGEINEVDAIAETLEPIRFTKDKTGKITEKVECDVDDTMLSLLRFDSGAIGQVSFSWGGHGEAFRCGNVIYGSKGCIRDDVVIFDDGNKTTIEELFKKNSDPKVTERFFPKGITNPFALETLDFLTAIREGREMETSGKEGLRDLAIGFAVLESSLSGKSIKVEDIISGKCSMYEEEINKYYNL